MFVRFALALFVCMSCNKQGRLAFRTTRVEDTHLMLAAIPFQVGEDNTLKESCSYKLTRKNCTVSVSVGSFIPWL